MSPDNAPMSLRKFFDERYKPHRLLGCSPRTVYRYSCVFRIWARFLGREPLLSDLEEDAVADFMVWYSEGRTPASVNTFLNHIMALANYAVRKRLIDEVPDVRSLPEPAEIPTVWTLEEVGQLFRAAGQTSGWICDGLPARKFWPALFMVAFDTALRAGAIWKIQCAHIDLEARQVHVPASHQKTRKAQTLRFSPDTAAAIAAIMEPSRKVLFQWPYSEATKYYRIKRINMAAGLPSSRRDQLQRLRRTCLTMAHNLGIDACAQAGHSSDQVTRRHYLNVSQARQAADVLPRPTIAGQTILPSVQAGTSLDELVSAWEDAQLVAGTTETIAHNSSLSVRRIFTSCSLWTTADIATEPLVGYFSRNDYSTPYLHRLRCALLRFFKWLAGQTGSRASEIKLASISSALSNEKGVAI